MKAYLWKFCGKPWEIAMEKVEIWKKDETPKNIKQVHERFIRNSNTISRRGIVPHNKKNI